MMVIPSDIYCQVAAKPILKKATILNQGDTSQCHINLQWEQEDPIRRDSVEFQQTAILSIDAESRNLCLTSLTEATFTSLTHGFPFPKEGNCRVLWDLYDELGGTRAICIEYNPPIISKSAPLPTRASCSVAGAFVQIWSANRIRKTITLPTKGSDAKHGRVYPDGPAVFSGACLSRNGTRIVYTAEEYRPDDPEHTRLIGTGQPSLDNSPFAYRENWGEGVADVYQPVLCLLDIESELVTCIVDLQTYIGVAPTRPVWTRNDEAVVCLGYALGAYPLGVTYCTQRPCRVYAIWPASGHMTALSSADYAASCPRFSPDGRHLIWLQEPVGGPHRHCRALVALAWPPVAEKPETIVACVNQPGEDGFPDTLFAYRFKGLYDDLPLRCWTADSSSIITSSVWGFKTAALLISVVKPTGEYARDEVQLIPSPVSANNNDGVTGQRRLDSVSVLDVHKNLAVASVSSPDRAPFLSVLYLEKTLSSTGPRAFSSDMWICVPASMPNELAEDKSSRGGISWPVDVECSYNLIQSGNLKDRNLSESLLVIPTVENYSAELLKGGLAATRSRSPGLVVWPHGGPHSSFTAGWSPLLAAFLGCGFACLLINYRGSLGYGEDQILGLIEAGIGQEDVADCAQATRLATTQLAGPFGKPPSVFLFGGSHGGFLCLWLAAGHASLYRASVVRNPVSHLVSMVDTSDIPDWCYAESGLLPLEPGGADSYQLGHTPNEGELARLSRVSPLPRITSNWSTPLLLCLGGRDCRVPMSQGLSVLRKIRSVAKDVPCQALVFPHDAHPLASPAASREVFLATFDWFTQHA